MACKCGEITVVSVTCDDTLIYIYEGVKGSTYYFIVFYFLSRKRHLKSDGQWFN